MSLIDRISLTFRRVIVLPLVSAYFSIRSRIAAKRRGLNVSAIVAVSLDRATFTVFSGREIQAALPTVRDAYDSWISDMQNISSLPLENDVETLEDGTATINWVGRRSKSSIVLLIFHGGGYVLPCSRDIFLWVHDMIEQMEKVGLEVSGAVLGYSLSPAQYPTQLHQASLALNHLIASGYDPSKIIIGGDSAGGHLTHSLLSHILHPRPGIAGVNLPAPLAGSFLISPVITADTSSEAYSRNHHIDFLSTGIMRGAFDGECGGAFPTEVVLKEKMNHQGWAEPLCTDDEWFKDLASKAVKSVLITGALNEVLIDQIIDFDKKLQKVDGLDLQRYWDEEETHDVAPQQFRPGEQPGKTARKLTDWLVQVGKNV